MRDLQHFVCLKQFGEAARVHRAWHLKVLRRMTLRHAANPIIDQYPVQRTAAPMNIPVRGIALCLASLIAILSFVSSPACAGPVLAGTYKITENTDLGSEIRLRVQPNFFNSGDGGVTVTKVALRSASASNQFVSTSTHVVVQAHFKSQVTLQFLIANQDFKSWSTRPHQRFYCHAAIHRREVPSGPGRAVAPARMKESAMLEKIIFLIAPLGSVTRSVSAQTLRCSKSVVGGHNSNVSILNRHGTYGPARRFKFNFFVRARDRRESRRRILSSSDTSVTKFIAVASALFATTLQRISLTEAGHSLSAAASSRTNLNTQAAIAFERPARAFTANHRQVDPQMNFLTRGCDYELIVTADTTALPRRRTSCTAGEGS
jgi:hypothetical protein